MWVFHVVCGILECEDLVDVEGSVETARHGCEMSVMDERKTDQVVSELDRYCVVVAALQETKWVASEVYSVGNSFILTTGREVPGADFVRQGGEDVTIVLSDLAVSAWRAGGSKWKVWSSRLVTATLKVGDGRNRCLHVLSCYAPTFATSREKKDAFFARLHDALSAIPSDESFVVLGDFNARAGSRGLNDG